MKHLRCAAGRAILAVIYMFAVVAIVMSGVASANDDAKDAKDAAKTVQGAAQKGFPLNSSSTDVTGNVSVEAVLIPAKIAKTVFGKEVANNYAVIALTISNRSSDDSFIVNTIFIDYSQWLLSGGEPWESTALCTPSQAAKAAEKEKVPEKNKSPSMKCGGNTLQTWQQQTSASQISSIETRVVRGELLDRQPWTYRNWIIRALQAVGSVAAGFTFATTNQDWIRGIGAYNGNFIPAAQSFWPDATVGQMNRISDFGFQVNKVIGKQSSDIVVAFFPIDRFLTPDLKSIFLSSPAVFFAPFAALADPTVKNKLAPYIKFVFASPDTNPTDAEATEPTPLKSLKKHMSEVVSGACEKFDPRNSPAPPDSVEQACQAAELVDRLSLNVVRVIVGGTMTVDVNKVPPQIHEIDFDVPDGKDKVSIFTVTDSKATTLTGVIRGSFLGGATPAITDPKDIQVAAVAKDSNDAELHFTITFKETLKSGTKLTFEVSKKSDGATIKSDAYVYTIGGDTDEGAKSEGKPKPAASAGTPGAPMPTPVPPNK